MNCLGWDPLSCCVPENAQLVSQMKDEHRPKATLVSCGPKHPALATIAGEGPQLGGIGIVLTGSTDGGLEVSLLPK